MPAVLFFSLLLGGVIVHHLLLFGNEKMMMKETGSSFLLDRMIIEGERDWWEEWDPKQKVYKKQSLTLQAVSRMKALSLPLLLSMFAGLQKQTAVRNVSTIYFITCLIRSHKNRKEA
ncbi:hypothetical protein, partial [Thalassobacillus sp. C254]|uniref:hypothetical protein n=1 Tax=Thalassobacillus sp. C254 TaxID=1225341 RepID=UPI0006D11586